MYVFPPSPVLFLFTKSCPPFFRPFSDPDENNTGFKGPRVNIEHAMLGRAGNVVDGVVVSDKDAAIVHDPDEVGSSSGASETKKTGFEKDLEAM